MAQLFTANPPATVGGNRHGIPLELSESRRRVAVCQYQADTGDTCCNNHCTLPCNWLTDAALTEEDARHRRTVKFHKPTVCLFTHFLPRCYTSYFLFLVCITHGRQTVCEIPGNILLIGTQYQSKFL